MTMIPMPEFGPMVECPETGEQEYTQRPPGGEGPWFCRACGSTDHEPAPCWCSAFPMPHTTATHERTVTA